jgi:hypothetical protein
MTLTAIQQDLIRATYNRNDPDTKAFIPYESVRRIWAGVRLEQFLKDHDPTLSDQEIAEARHGLLRTISILVGIVHQDWSGWSRFKAIFFDDNRADLRRDTNALALTLDELEDTTFLGNHGFARLFMQDVWVYFPVVLQGLKEIPYEEKRRLPLYQEESVVREGFYGKVTKEVIPGNHLILSHLSDNLGIPEAPHPVS